MREGRAMKLEEIVKGALITGIAPGRTVRVVSVDSMGDNAITIVYRADDGSLGDRMLFRSNEADLSITTAGQP